MRAIVVYAGHGHLNAPGNAQGEHAVARHRLNQMEQAGFGTAHQDFVTTEGQGIGKSTGDLTAWTPPAKSRERGQRRRTPKNTAAEDQERDV